MHKMALLRSLISHYKIHVVLFRSKKYETKHIEMNFELNSWLREFNLNEKNIGL